jgi:hypothetical protein
MLAFSFASRWPGHINGFQQQDKANFVSHYWLTNLRELLTVFDVCLPATRESPAVNRVD